MTMGLESLTPFLLSDIPADVALAVGGVCGTAMTGAIVALFRRNVVLEDRLQANIQRNADSAYATADAINKLTQAIGGTTRGLGK